MRIGQAFQQFVHRLNPGCFAMVMATGLVSIDVNQHGMPVLARVLFAFNALAWLWLLALTTWRLLRWRHAVVSDFVDPGRGAGFLTLAAATCVLGTQCLLVVPLPALAWVLAALGAVFWALLTYLFLVATITARFKPGFTRSINGGWLVAVVTTQALSVLVTLLAAYDRHTLHLAFVGLCLYMIGAALYLLIITLVVYRMVFFPMRAREFKPPYWINMGALAITTLAGSLLVIHAPGSGPLQELVPFVKGFTLFFWAMATWWIPLLLTLEVWRHLWWHVPLRYESDDWDIVFPIGMYTTCTYAMAHALHVPFLLPIAAIGVYVNLLVWLVVAAAGVLGLGHWLFRHARNQASASG